MTVPIPSTHVQDSQKLTADAVIELFTLTPTGTSAKFRFKNDNTVTWLGNEYVGLPLQFSGENWTSDGNNQQPSLVIGQPNIDLSMFKGLIYDGTIDNARLDRELVLLDDIINNNDIKITRSYRIKRVENYSASSINLALATFSVSGPSTLPFRQFIPPAFPFVKL